LVVIINLIIDNPNSFVRRQNDDIYIYIVKLKCTCMFVIFIL